MMPKRLSISLVIPAYNEESHLAACLKAAKSQLLPFDEIIVVDNNSTDRTAEIARQFPGVRVIKESRQGVVYARNTGFSSAAGDIIARIDADTHVRPDWTQNLLSVFEDDDVDAVSGSVRYYDIAYASLINRIDKSLRGWMAANMGDVFLWGANMAIRSRVWHQIADTLCVSGKFHEDLDLAAHLGTLGRTVAYSEALHAEVSGRRIDTNPLKFLQYVILNDRSYARHNIKERRYMYPAMALILGVYVPIRLLYRGFDHKSGGFSWREVFNTKGSGRVDPAVFKV